MITAWVVNIENPQGVGLFLVSAVAALLIQPARYVGRESQAQSPPCVDTVSRINFISWLMLPFHFHGNEN